MALTRNHSAQRRIDAGGAVLWRPGPDGPELGLIHRPRYDDWSFPKGKAEPGEHILLTAVREVFEETGQRVALGRRLPSISYPLVSGATKRVQYWAGRALSEREGGGHFEPNHEVDRLAWLSPAEARRRLSRPLDVTVLNAFLAASAATVPLVLLRHGAAERRSQRYPEDRIRPLSIKGHEQAGGLAELLQCFGTLQVVSSPAVRCVDTVRPYAGSQYMVIDIDPALSEAAHAAAPRAIGSWIRALIAEGEPTVLCSHRPVLDDMLAAVLAQAAPEKKAAQKAAAGRSAPPRRPAGAVLSGTGSSRAVPQSVELPTVNGRPWTRREADRLLGADRSGGRLAPGEAWLLHVTPRLGPRRPPRVLGIDRLRPSQHVS
jgi:8-oxo-dGTP pyrophosphatase MutT (NUDIX family)/phosphohistidine phosphatase SixA